MFKKLITALALCLFASQSLAASNINTIVSSPEYTYVSTQNGLATHYTKTSTKPDLQGGIPITVIDIPEKGKGQDIIKSTDIKVNQDITDLQKTLKKDIQECNVGNRTDLTQDQKNVIRGMCTLFLPEHKKEIGDRIALHKKNLALTYKKFKDWSWSETTLVIKCDTKTYLLGTVTMFDSKGNITDREPKNIELHVTTGIPKIVMDDVCK